MASYRPLLRPELDSKTISNIRMTLDQGQPLGDGRFIDSIEQATGQRRKVWPRGRPRKPRRDEMGAQNQMPLEI